MKAGKAFFRPLCGINFEAAFKQQRRELDLILLWENVFGGMSIILDVLQNMPGAMF